MAGMYNQQPYPGPQYQQPYPSPQFPPPYQQPKKNSGGKCLVLGLLAIIVIAGGIVGFFFIGNQMTVTRNKNATATTTAYNTTHYPFSTTLEYQDTLKGSSPGWPNQDNCRYSNLGYQALLTDTTVYRCENIHQKFLDGTYEVTINDLGNVYGAGIIFHYNTVASDKHIYYLAMVYKDGKYALQAVDSRVSDQPYTMDSGSIPNFKAGVPIRLGVNVWESTISMFVDSTMIGQKIVDSQHNYPIGSIGVLIENQALLQSASVVTYTDAKIWYLEGVPPIM